MTSLLLHLIYMTLVDNYRLVANLMPAHWLLNIDWLDVLTNIVSIRIQFRRIIEIWESNRRKYIRMCIFAQ